MQRVAAEKKPKVLVLCQLFYPELVSTGQTMTELCEVLIEKGLDVEVICAPMTHIQNDTSVPGIIYHKGIKIRRVYGTRFPKLNLLGRVINQCTYAISVILHLMINASRDPVIVLTNPPYLAFLCVLLNFMKVKRPYIYVIFDVYPDTAVNLDVISANGIIAKVWDRLNIYSIKKAAHVVVIGRCMENVIRNKLAKIGCDPGDRLSIIHVWSDDRAIIPGRKSNAFVNLWELNNKFVIAYSGNMGRFHDMETIMAAANKLSNMKNIVFLFIGEGHKKSWMIEYAERHGLTNCQFHSYVERERLGDMLSCADIGLVSLLEGQEGLSVPSKCFGLMAAGIPVIGIMPSNSEIALVIKEEQCGIVVPPSDIDGLVSAIMELYNKPQLCVEMGVNGRKGIDAKYSLDSAADAYVDLIMKLGINTQPAICIAQRIQ